jgi:DNA mismatch repair protein MutL
LQIRSLPEDVVHLIAASEVIDSLAAVVRELAENALDAGADRIVISLWPEQWRVMVADNGVGMDLENLQQAATPHSTSKITSIADLSNILTLGFRGEALHSLAQLAELEILSRPNDDCGWQVQYNHQGKVFSTEAVAIAPGTIVNVSNLFGEWNVRRQASPTAAQQLRGVQQVVQQMALCHPGVSWQVRRGTTPWLHIHPAQTAQAILPQFIRGLRGSDLHHKQLIIHPETDNNTQQIELVLGLPDRCHRSKPDWVKIAVNGRIVRSAELEQTLLTGLSRTCPRDRYPICFVHLQVSADQIDWNRHPTKAEVYLRHLNFWQEQIQMGIHQILALDPENHISQSDRVQQFLKVSEAQGTYNTSDSVPSPLSSTDKSQQIQSNVMELEAIAQVHQTYIVAEHPGGLWLVEQHIAHERVLYEQLCENWQPVSLESPIILQQLSAEQLEQLQRLNLEVEAFGEGLWAVRTAPELLAKRSDCSEALIELSLAGDLQAAQVATACRSAIRNGTPLSLAEMQSLLDQWVRTCHPRTCPHGRPIYLRLDESSLSRFFRRHWVIGKSHGI